MSTTFRSGETLRAAKLNRLMLQQAAQASEVSAISVVGKSVGQLPDRWGAVDRAGDIDMAGLLNDAVQECIARGDPLAPGNGTYRLNSRLYLRSGMRLLNSDATKYVFHMNTSGSNGCVAVPDQNAALDAETRESGIVWRGGTIQQAGHLGPDGRLWVPDYSAIPIGFYADDVLFDGLTIDGWGGRVIVCGNNIRFNGLRMLHPVVTAGGIRPIGGRNIRVDDADIDCEDDTFQMVIQASGVWGDLTIEECLYTNCWGRATINKLCSVNSSGALTAAVKNSGYYNIRGEASGKLIGCVNYSSSGVFENITFKDIYVRDTGTYSNTQAIDVKGLGGGIDGLLFERVRTEDCRNIAMTAYGAVDNLTVRDCNFGAPSDDRAVGAIKLLGVRDALIEGTVLDTGPGSGIEIGGPAATDTGFFRRGRAERVTIRKTVIKGLRGNAFGIKVVNADVTTVADVAFRPDEANGAARALYVMTASSNTKWDDLDVRDLGGTDTPVADKGRLTIAGRLIGESAPGSVAILRSRRRVHTDAAISRSHSPTSARSLSYGASGTTDEGSFVEVAQNAARWRADDALIISGARSFLGTNPRAVGGGPGPLHVSTSYMPTGWGISVPSGWEVDRLADQVINGLNGAVFRFQTLGVASTLNLYFNATISTSEGDARTMRAYFALLSGALGGITSIRQGLIIAGGSGTYRTSLADQIGPEPVSFDTVVSSAPSSTTSVRPNFALTSTASVNSDLTVWMACPTVEAGSFATVAALPTAGGTGAVTRGTDALQMALPSGYESEAWVTCSFLLQRAAGAADQGILVLDDGTANNRFSLHNVASGLTIGVRSVVSGSEEFTGPHGEVVVGELMRAALAWSSGTLRLAVSGMDNVMTFTGTLPSVTRIVLGHASADLSAPLNGDYYSAGLTGGVPTDAQMLAAVAG